MCWLTVRPKPPNIGGILEGPLMKSSSHARERAARTRGPARIGWVMGIALLILLSRMMGIPYPVPSHDKAFIDWAGLRNPILEYKDWSIKDAAMAYQQG